MKIAMPECVLSHKYETLPPVPKPWTQCLRPHRVGVVPGHKHSLHARMHIEPHMRLELCSNVTHDLHFWLAARATVHGGQPRKYVLVSRFSGFKC